MSIEAILHNPYGEKKISNPRLLNYGGDVINKIDARNQGNQYPFLADLKLKFTPFKNNLINKSGEYAIYRSLAADQDLFIEQVFKNLHIYDSDLNIKYGLNAPKKIEFFPSGITEYTTARHSELEIYLIRLGNAFTRNSGDFTVQKVADVVADGTGYSGKREATGKQFGIVKQQRGLVIDSHIDFADELYRAILKLTDIYYKDPQRVKEFMSLELLYPRHKKVGEAQEAAKIFTLTVQPVTTLEAGIQFTDETSMSITPDMDLDVWTGPSATTPRPDKPAKAIADIQNIWKAYQLGAAGNRYLFFFNPDETDAVDVEIVYL